VATGKSKAKSKNQAVKSNTPNPPLPPGTEPGGLTGPVKKPIKKPAAVNPGITGTEPPPIAGFYSLPPGTEPGMPKPRPPKSGPVDLHVSFGTGSQLKPGEHRVMNVSLKKATVKGKKVLRLVLED
jgi:hypothetical protein